MTYAENYANRSAFYKTQRRVQTCIECGKQRLVQRNKAARRFCSLECYWKWNSKRKGEKAPSWRGGRHLLQGYVRVYLESGIYESEHILLAEKAIGKKLPPKAEVHHFNENRADNTPGNLVICNDHAYHALLHLRARIVRAGGNPNTDKICSRCRSVKPLEAFNRSNKDSTKRDTYCRLCQSERYHERQTCQK